MEAVGINTLKQKLTTFLKKVELGESIMIISRGHEIARLVPPGNKMEKARTELEKLRKTAFIGDVISPVEEEWEMMK